MSALVEETDKPVAVPEVTGKVRLVSSDGESFEIEANVAVLSQLVADGIEGKSHIYNTYLKGILY